MKHLKYFFVLLLGVLIVACTTDVLNPDDPDNPNIPTDPSIVLKEKIEKIVPVNVLSEAKSLGMPIYDGVDPPTITGSYVLDDQTMKKSNIEGDEPSGTKYVDEVLTISNQSNDNYTATLKIESDGETYTYNAVISGSGDKFTLYISMRITFEDNTSAKAVMLYSAVLKEDALHDVHYGMFFVEQPYSGMGHVIYEADGIAHKKNGDPGDDIVVAEGETATGEYAGSDLTMQFPSDLTVTIKASNNQGADHGTVTVSEFKEFPMMELGDNTVLDFSKTSSIYTVDVETFIAKGLDAEKDIDCSLFTIDKQAVEATNGRIFKSVDFTYDKETGKLTFSTKMNTPFSETKVSGARYSHMAINIIEDYTVTIETIRMKAPYVEQLDNTCWAACAMMFIRSYTNLEPDMRNSYLAFVRRMGHERLDKGWTTNFFNLWEYDTGNLVNEISRMIGGGIKVSSASFRLTKSAANEMVKLIDERRPVILNYGDHVLYVIGYKRTSGSELISFLVHDPQGKSGDIYKWIVWDDYLKAKGFKERLFLGDALYIIYADKPMLDNPILQTMAVATADTEKRIHPTGSDLSFYMQAYGKSRMVFPQYDINELDGLRWGKKGYDEGNLSNDTIYSLSKLTVGVKIYNTDDKAAPISIDMNFSTGSIFKHYTADISCPAGSEYIIKENQLKESNGKDFDPTLKNFFKQQGNPDLYVDFSLYYDRKSNYKAIDRFIYPRLIVKSDTIEEPEEFKALRPILKDIYESYTNKKWSDEYMWLEEDLGNQNWGYRIHSSIGDLVEVSGSGKNFMVTLFANKNYSGDIKVGNHHLPDGWKWTLLSRSNNSKLITIENEYIRMFQADVSSLQKLNLSSISCFVQIVDTKESLPNLVLDFKNTDVNLIASGIQNIVVESAKDLSLSLYKCENGSIKLANHISLESFGIDANNYSIIGNNDFSTEPQELKLDVGKGPSNEKGKFILSGLNLRYLAVRSYGNPNLHELFIENFGAPSLHLTTWTTTNSYVDKIFISNCEELNKLKITSTSVEKVSVSNCQALNDLSIQNSSVLNDVEVINSPNMTNLNLAHSKKMGGSFGQWPKFMQEMYNAGNGKGIYVAWRYSYKVECVEYEGEKHCEYVLEKDKGYGFYFDDTEPGSFDLGKYNSVGFSYYPI